MKGGIPVCIFEHEIGMFRILQAKGKAISSFGVSWTTTTSMATSTATSATIPADQDSNNIGNASKKKQSTTAEYLFIEEALFLHERGLIQVFTNSKSESVDNNNDSKSNNNTHNNADSNANSNNGSNTKEKETETTIEQQQQQKLLDTQDLYVIMLHQLHLPLQVYLTYSYLRSQTYIVIRHTINRLSIIRSMQNNNTIGDGIDNTNANKRKRSHKDFRLNLRHDTFHAPIPFVFGLQNQTNDISPEQNSNIDDNAKNNDDDNSANKYINNKHIAFDVYKPNTQYRKTNPNQPDFYVAISNYAQPSPTFDQINELIKSCDGIPIRMATVADGGTVLMFGLTDYGVPTLDK